MALTNEQLLEALTECIRSYRRSSVRFPNPFDLSKIVWNTEQRRIEMDLLMDGDIVKYDLLLDRVNYHGETSDDSSTNTT